MVKISAPDLLGSVLGNEIALSFEIFDMASSVRIEDIRGKTLMTAKESGARVTLTDMFGNSVLTYKLDERDVVVTKNGRIFGTMEGVSNKANFPRVFRVLNGHGEFMFEVERGNSFQFSSGGSVLATAGRMSDDFIWYGLSLKFSAALDINTKAMMIATCCHLVFVLVHEVFRRSNMDVFGPGAKCMAYLYGFTFLVLFLYLLCLTCHSKEASEQRERNVTSGFIAPFAGPSGFG